MNDRIDTAQIEFYWGSENLTRWSDVAVRDLRMSNMSKEFLTHVGLPAPGREIYAWDLEWEAGLPRFGGTHDLRLLARNRGFSSFLIDEGRGGCIIWRADDDGYERYVNATVEQFAASLVEMDKFRQETWRTLGEPYNEPLYARRIAALSTRLKAIDETAIGNKNSLWSAIIHSMELELG